MCVPSSCCHPAPSEIWPRPCQQGESNWTEWEVRLQLVITCWLKAQMAQTPARCSRKQQSKKALSDRLDRQTQEPQRNPRQGWGITACRFDAGTWRPRRKPATSKCEELKASISCFHRQGLGVTAQWLGKVKKWAGCNDFKIVDAFHDKSDPIRAPRYQRGWPAEERVEKRGHRGDNGTYVQTDYLLPLKDFWYISLLLWFIR